MVKTGPMDILDVKSSLLFDVGFYKNLRHLDFRNERQ